MIEEVLVQHAVALYVHQGVMMMRFACNGRFADVVQELSKSGIAGEADADGNGINKQTDHGFDTLDPRRSAGNHGTEHHVVPVIVTGQQDTPDCLEARCSV